MGDPIDSQFKANIEKVVGMDESSHGSISGMLEAINIHQGARFTIYPNIGPSKVTGVAHSKELRDLIKAGIDRHVTAYGILKYKNWDPFPYAIEADDIEIHPLPDDLPSLKSLGGTVPKLTGELSTEEFIERVRSERW